MPRSSGLVVTRVRAAAAHQLTPSFTRIELASSALADFGATGPYFDQRIKLLFPPRGGVLPDLSPVDGSWYEAWRRIPEAERGFLRTYSVRDVTGEGEATRVVVDFVLHLAAGSSGPAAEWARQAQIGDELILVGPRRGGGGGGGIEFDAGEAETLLLVGDETAVPAISRILADLPADARGDVFMEVPLAVDVVPVEAPVGMHLHWLPREGADHGSRLRETVSAHIGHRAGSPPDENEVDPLIWETPAYSSSGEEVGKASRATALYAWVAGEASMVTALRRLLVGVAGVSREQVAFMGYWRQGSTAVS